MKQQTSSRAWNFLFLLMGFGAFLILGVTATFARNGGNAYVMSEHAEVDIEAPVSGHVIAVAGDDNIVSMAEPEPMPEAPPARNGAWFINGMLTAALVFIGIFIYWLRNHFWQGNLSKEQL